LANTVDNKIFKLKASILWLPWGGTTTKRGSFGVGVYDSSWENKNSNICKHLKMSLIPMFKANQKFF
jgi:hypothetical protein